MPIGKRRVILATLAFVIAVPGLGYFIAWVLWPGSPQLPTYGWEETAYSEYQAGGASCQPSEIVRLRTDSERARKRQACEDAVEQHRIETNDLKQQTRAADAAAASVWIAEWQSKATVFGLIVGFYTLAAAAAAAFYARTAAHHTERGVKAAEGAVAVTRRIGEAQVRAYPTVVRMEGFNTVRGHGLVATIRNSGLSPALDIAGKWDLLLPNGTTDSTVTNYGEQAGAGEEISLAPFQFYQDVGTNRIIVTYSLTFIDEFLVNQTNTRSFGGVPSEWSEERMELARFSEIASHLMFQGAG